MKKYNAFRCLIIIIIIMSVMLSACFYNDLPPDVSNVEQLFLNNYNEIQIVMEYLIDSKHDKLYIQDTSGAALADLNTIYINDERVFSAIKQLLTRRIYKQIYKSGNTISFLQWTGIHDIGCGIAYSIDQKNRPEVQFMTELIPLSSNGWFYYVSDYNKWRAENKTGDGFA